MNALAPLRHVIADIRMREGSRANDWKAERWVTCTCGFHAVAVSADELAEVYAQHKSEQVTR